MFEPVKSADRALQILEAVRTTDEPLTATALGSLLRIPKSSIHAILRTLEFRKWLSTDPMTGHISLGTKALLFRDAQIPASSLEATATPALAHLSSATGETVHLGILEDTDIVYVAKRESIHPLRLYSAVGRRLPAHATAMGKALLAAKSDDEVRELLPDTLEQLTPRTTSTRSALLGELHEIRELGYAIDREENAEGITCFGKAIHTEIPAAISVSLPTSRLTSYTEAAIRDLLLALTI